MARRSSTDGASEPEVSEKAVEAPPAVSSTLDQPPAETPPMASASPQDMSLPNGNILHSQVYMSETQIRLATYNQGLTLLESEMANVEGKFVADVQELTIKKDTTLADLQKRADDLRLAVKMATAPIEIYEQEHAS